MRTWGFAVMEEYTCPNCKNPIYDEDALLCHFCGEEMITTSDDDKIQFYNECRNHEITVQIWYEKRYEKRMGEWVLLAGKPEDVVDGIIVEE